MPPILWVFIVLSGIAHGTTVVKAIDQKDPKVGMKLGPTAVEYIAWTAPRYIATEDRKGGCDFKLFVRVNGRGLMRLQVHEVEQLLDDSWSFDYRIKPNERGEVDIRFVEPIGGFTVREMKVWFKCEPKMGFNIITPAQL